MVHVQDVVERSATRPAKVGANAPGDGQQRHLGDVVIRDFQQLGRLAQRPQRRPPPPDSGRDMSAFTMLRPDGFPLNVDPEVVPAEEAPLQPGDMVMGVEIGGQARAYPVNYMNGPFNEVVNDLLGGVAIAPSW